MGDGDVARLIDDRCQWYDGHPSSACLRPAVEIAALPDNSVRRLCEVHLKDVSFAWKTAGWTCPT